MVLDSLFPVFVMILFGSLLKRWLWFSAGIRCWRPEPENRPDIFYAADFTGPVYPVLAAQQRYQPGIGFNCAADDSVVYIPVDCAVDLKCAPVTYC